MKFDKNDQIEYSSDCIKHESAGGFVFFEDPRTHKLFVSLLKTTDGQYVIPKGHIQKNEKPEEAATREVKEELSLVGNIPKIVSFLGVDSYEFILEDGGINHFKNVHLYVFESNEKMNIKPLKEEGFEAAEWFLFNVALEKISFDKENLLKARQSFYYNKSVKIYKNLSDVLSITISIPTYNGGKTIKKTLISVEKRLKELPGAIKKEIIICADHCTDDTKELVESFIEEKKVTDIDIKLLVNEGDKGKAETLNKIFGNSSGNLFCVIDDDVILKNQCLKNLIKAFIEDSDLRCVFSSWSRLPLKSKNPWKIFWHYVFGIKFDIQPYDKHSEFMRGACMMFRRESFVWLPKVINEDQFIQYIYWPKTKEVKSSILYFNSVYSISDYYRRFIRIMFGSKQVSEFFTKERVEECNKALFRKIEYKRIMVLPWNKKLAFLFYRFIRFFINIYVKRKINSIEDYEWFRFKQS